ncbi:MAG: CotH kinase family protein [Lachnospiraceae bacterium]|nr:CotH kinase family protein [Lachnospiraceae bacterium]
MKKAIKIVPVVLALSLLTGCRVENDLKKASTDTEMVLTGNNQLAEINGNLPIKDNDSLYEDWDSTEVETMYLTVEKGNKSDNTDHTFEEINSYSAEYYEKNNLEKYKVEGILRVGDENGPVDGEFGYDDAVPNCTVNVRGQSSSRFAQKNYKISIMDGKGDWHGQKIINLNKHVSDGLRFKNMLCYNLMQDIDTMHSARTKFVHLYIKDNTADNKTDVYEDYGLYTYVEQINKNYLKNHNLDNNGQLYKVNIFEFYRYNDVIKLKSDLEYDKKAFEERLEIKGDSDHSKLIELLDELNNDTIPIEKTFSKWFDEDNVFSWLAFHILVGNKDTQCRNVFLYSPKNVKKFYFISWDNDGSFLDTQYALLERSEMNENSYEKGISNYWGNILIKKVVKNDTYRQKLIDKVNELKGILTEEKVMGLAKEYAAIVKPYLYRMPDVNYAKLTSNEFDKNLDALYSELENNYNTFMENVNEPMPFFIGKPEATENGINYSWQSAYTFNGELVSYDVEISDDCSFDNIIYGTNNYSGTTYEGEKLEPGKYFIRIKAVNESGKEAYAFDNYKSADKMLHRGMICYYVLDSGEVLTDEDYEEMGK